MSISVLVLILLRISSLNTNVGFAGRAAFYLPVYVPVVVVALNGHQLVEMSIEEVKCLVGLDETLMGIVEEDIELLVA